MTVWECEQTTASRGFKVDTSVGKHSPVLAGTAEKRAIQEHERLLVRCQMSEGRQGSGKLV